MSDIKKRKEIDKTLSVKTKNGEYSNNNKCRSILTVYWKSEYKKTAIAIGINPSKADDDRSDKTLTTLSRFLDAYGFCEIKMFNIFESYSTDQNGIDKSKKTEFARYADVFEKVDYIFIVWGTDEHYMDEKKNILSFLKNYKDKTYCIKNNNNDFPIHPSRMQYEYTIIKYPFEN